MYQVYTSYKNLRIGAGSNEDENNPASFIGDGSLIDDFRIYNKVLSASEVYSIYNSSSVYNYANTDNTVSPYFDGFVKNSTTTASSMQYPGYVGHENDLIAWLKFDDNANKSYNSITKTNWTQVGTDSSANVELSKNNMRGSSALHILTDDNYYISHSISNLQNNAHLQYHYG